MQRAKSRNLRRRYGAPQACVDIGAVLGRKQEAYLLHKSQVGQRPSFALSEGVAVSGVLKAGCHSISRLPPQYKEGGGAALKANVAQVATEVALRCGMESSDFAEGFSPYF